MLYGPAHRRECMEVQESRSLQDLNLVDRFLFDETMEVPGMYQIMVNILLENKVTLLDRVQTEKEFRISPELRSVRLDVVSMDTTGKLYYTEMQKKNTGNLLRRSRYYQGQLDVSLLEPGSVDFNLLNDTCLILITPFDLFGKGLYRYTFSGVCEECPELRLRDGAVRVFINTKGINREGFSQEFLDFMEYLTDTSDQRAEMSSSERIREMHRAVQKIRASEKMGVKYMQKWEERVYDRLEGKIEGKKEAKADLNKLNQALLRDNRLEDLVRSTTDPEFQEQLLREYHISA